VVTDQQVKKMRTELDKHGNLSRAAMNADLDPKTARKYRDSGRLPTQSTPERTWRTRADPFEDDWPDIEAKLRDAPELEAKTLFDDLVLRKPGKYVPNQLRTLQRHVRDWRAASGPPKEVFFAQEHRPGEAIQTDFTDASELNITIGGEPFPHLLCHCVLPYSNWDWATPTSSESLLGMKSGLQEALRQLGGVPEKHQTDNSTAATHARAHGRAFNAGYALWMQHLGLTPVTTAIGEKEQNGDVEAGNGALKRRLEQHLLMRGHRDFDSRAAYKAWLGDILRAGNVTREARVAVERPLLKPLPASWFPDFVEESVLVTPWSTIRVDHNTYSVPSRLIGVSVRVRRFDDRLEISFRGEAALIVPRLLGRNGHRVDYRHIIWSLVRKPGAFARYRYREDLFPSLVFRRAYDRLREQQSERTADREYVRILHLAASTSQSDVERALVAALGGETEVEAAGIRAVVRPETPAIPAMEAPPIDLTAYDGLIAGGAR
jgi:hypothetical protein